jgi:two-component system KDP operon response regulator KdpE
MQRARILVVDDDEAIIKFLRANLEAEGCETFIARDGTEALQSIERELPDLVILDIMLPKIDGFEVLRRVREWSQIPIVALSARGERSDKIKCLNLGADDYITKPFGVDELIARFRAVLRRTKEEVTPLPAQSHFASGDLTIDFAARRVTVAGNEVRLTQIEYKLLQELTMNSDTVLTYEYLLKKIWGAEYGTEREYLHVYIGSLRAKIETDRKYPDYIINIPGVGYRFQHKE